MQFNRGDVVYTLRGEQFLPEGACRAIGETQGTLRCYNFITKKDFWINALGVRAVSLPELRVLHRRNVIK